ncbi:MAG: ester cyclase, partial [Pseudomonadota bacterium]
MSATTDDPHAAHKRLVSAFRTALYSGTSDEARRALSSICADDAVFHHCHPIGDHTGADAFFDAAFAPLITAMPDMERRDYIVMAGQTPEGADWVGCGGTYVGTFMAPWLEIPPTGHIAHMRFHEFYRIADGQLVEFQ